MLLKFSKYEGLGNDFILVDKLLSVQQCILLCDRYKGVGADGVIQVLAGDERAIARMHIVNRDGSVAEMCGNGFRCVVQWLKDQGKLGDSREGVILTDAGYKPFVIQDHLIRVNMGIAKVGLALRVDEIEGIPVDVGNPHFVIQKKLTVEEVFSLGPRLEHNKIFPSRTNVEFVSVVNDNEIDLLVWERGVGLTKACGTGACAAVAANVALGFAKQDEMIKVNLLGGVLWVKVGQDREIEMLGPARKVFDGEFTDGTDF